MAIPRTESLGGHPAPIPSWSAGAIILRRAAQPLIVLGVVTVVSGLSLAHSWAYGYTLVGDGWRLWMAALFAGILLVWAYGAGLPDLASKGRSRWVAALAATTGAGLTLSVLQLVLGAGLLPRFVMFGAVGFLTPWYAMCAALASNGVTNAERKDSVVLVVDRNEATDVIAELARLPERPAKVVATLSPAEAWSWGAEDRLKDAVRRNRASIVVLSGKAQLDGHIVGQAAALHCRGIRIRTLCQFYEEWLGKLPISELEQLALLFDIKEIHQGGYRPLKRILDVFAACIGLTVLALALPLVLVGNLVANRGPLLYRQLRLGKNGERFEIIKLRTMTADGTSTRWATEHDPRVTPFGRVLRRTHIDELPQFINVLRGDLSLVGPRPEQPFYAESLAKKIPFYSLRHLVQPGITGWAQVKYGYSSTENDALNKLQYEFYYMRHQSLAFDLRIVGRTIRSVVGGSGR